VDVVARLDGTTHGHRWQPLTALTAPGVDLTSNVLRETVSASVSYPGRLVTRVLKAATLARQAGILMVGETSGPAGFRQAVVQRFCFWVIGVVGGVSVMTPELLARSRFCSRTLGCCTSGHAKRLFVHRQARRAQVEEDTSFRGFGGCFGVPPPGGGAPLSMPA